MTAIVYYNTPLDMSLMNNKNNGHLNCILVSTTADICQWDEL